MKTLNCLLLLASLSITGLHAQTQSRLVAWTAYNNFYARDSAYYTYIGSNGGDLTHLLNFSYEAVYNNNSTTDVDSFALYEGVQESFNGNGTKSDSFTQSWENNMWVNEWRTLFNYDANSHDTLADYQNWNTTKWIGNEKTFYHYTNNKIDTETTEDTLFSGGWVNNTKTSYAYDNSSGLITDEAIEYWNTGNNSWSSFYNVQLQYYYDSFNNDTAFVYQFYDTAGAGKWVNSFKLVYIYDAHHNPITEVDWTWDTTTLKYDSNGLYKTTYKYDANFNDISDIKLYYNSNIPAWDTVETNSYTYNSYNQVTYHKSYNSGLFLPYSEFKYYYENYTAGLEQLIMNSDQLSVYPNPSSNFIHLTFTLQEAQPVLLSLYNMLGQQVWSADMGNTERVEATVPVTNLADGIYILKVNSGSTSQQKKVIVAR